ncbi:hypothetical protein Tco_1236482 [Tanacetum coccineum]
MIPIFHDMIKQSVKVFMDDFYVFGNSFDNCLNNLDNMLKHSKDVNLVINWEKCHFMVKEGIMLGHKVFGVGLEVDKAKIDVISKRTSPTNVKGIRSFLGHVGFYRRFIKDFSKITRPLTELLEDDPFNFDDECQPPPWGAVGWQPPTKGAYGCFHSQGAFDLMKHQDLGAFGFRTDLGSLVVIKQIRLRLVFCYAPKGVFGLTYNTTRVHLDLCSRCRVRLVLAIKQIRARLVFDSQHKGAFGLTDHPQGVRLALKTTQEVRLVFNLAP